MSRRGRLLVLPALAAALVGACTGGPEPAPPPGTGQPSTGPTSPTSPTDPGGPAAAGRLAAVGPMTVARAAHTATALPNGQVLVTGGCTRSGCEGPEDGRRAEVFDPGTGRFVPAGEMTTSRVGHTATALPGGRVLLAGGYSGEGTAPLATTELYDPAVGFRPGPAMGRGHGGHVAARLPGGRVLAIGGLDASGRVTAAAEVYDPPRGAFRPAASMTVPRAAATATTLRDGRVLVVGGQSSVGTVVASAEVYDPARDAWSPAGRLAVARTKHGAALLPNGDVLVVGGSGSDEFSDRLDSSEIWSARDRAFRPGPASRSPLFKLPDALVTLADGRVLVGGGSDAVQAVDPRGNAMRLVAMLPREAFFSVATALPDGRVLLTGGYDGGIVPADAAYLVRP
jgi:Kelch motif/Galactose oxidase, central domain